MSGFARVFGIGISVCLALGLGACGRPSGGVSASTDDQSQGASQTKSEPGEVGAQTDPSVQTDPPAQTEVSVQADNPSQTETPAQTDSPAQTEAPDAKDTDSGEAAASARAKLSIAEDYRDQFVHGEKTASDQKYIVLHDTEGDADAESVVNWWAENGNLVAAHFVVNKDGSIVQCVPLDCIAHHAGYGDTGHNQRFGVVDESRDDKLGTSPIGDWASDYGMNSYSIGIEMVHSGSIDTDYTEAQLEAVDGLIAYIDAYYGFESDIIDHKAWRTGNSDCSEEFEPYLQNYRTTRTHDGS